MFSETNFRDLTVEEVANDIKSLDKYKNWSRKAKRNRGKMTIKLNACKTGKRPESGEKSPAEELKEHFPDDVVIEAPTENLNRNMRQYSDGSISSTDTVLDGGTWKSF